MEKDDLHMRFIFLIISGIVLILAFVRMAKKNENEQTNQNHTKLQIMGFVIALLGIVEGVMGIYFISQIIFPEKSLLPAVYMNSIVRSPYQTQIWGMPTPMQQQSITFIAHSFMLFAISAYCVYFRSSNSKWWIKIIKVVFCIVLLMLYKPSTAFHYFDIYEWMNTVIFAILLYFAFREKKKKIEVKEQVQVVKEKIIEEPVLTIRNNEDESRFMPKSIVNTGAKTDELLPDLKAVSKEIESRFMPKVDLPVDDVVLNKDSVSEKNCEENPNNNVIIGINDTITSETEDNCHSEPTRKYCRFCGKEVNYKTEMFCKNCGNKL